MILATFLAALLQVTATPQAPADGTLPAAKPAGGWKDLDSVVLVINEDIVTSREINRELAAVMRRDHQLNSEADVHATLMALQASILERIVAAQAGENLGLDPAAIERQLKRYQEFMIERAGGVANLAELYKQRDLNTQDAQAAIRQSFFVELYENYVTGRGPGAKQRISRDAYVRPGQLLMGWEDLKDRPQDLAELGGAPSKVVLQRIDIDAHALGLEGARRSAAQLRQRILAGEDMEALGGEAGAKGLSYRRMEPFDVARTPALEPQLGAFLANAKEGDLSDLLPPPQRDSTLFSLVRLVKRSAPVIPDFRQAKVQNALRRMSEDELAKYRKLRALEALLSASYVWPASVLPKAAPEKRP